MRRESSGKLSPQPFVSSLRVAGFARVLFWPGLFLFCDTGAPQ